MRTLSSLPQRFEKSFRALARIGRDPRTKGYNRFAWTEEDRAAREWFRERADRQGLAVEQDRNGNLWAWWGDPKGVGAIVTGSHLDTVPNGGAYDGALGIVSGFLALDELRRSGFQPKRPLAVVAFADEEGARFGVATVGSRLLAGALQPKTLLRRRDVDRLTVAEAVRPFGVDPDGMGPDPERLARIAQMVELHVEQGRRLAPLGAAIGVGTEIWPHGRWQLRIEGEANHAGTTLPADRHDPTQVLGMVIGAARLLTDGPEAFATFGKIIVEPNGTNVIPSRVDAWLDARAAHEDDLDVVVMGVKAVAEGVAERHGLKVKFTCESLSSGVFFDKELRERIIAQLGCPEIPTGAGHDAGALSSVVPTAMLFVRNPTGVSHSPTESAETDDCVKGITALAAVLANLAGVPVEPGEGRAVPVEVDTTDGDAAGAPTGAEHPTEPSVESAPPLDNGVVPFAPRDPVFESASDLGHHAVGDHAAGSSTPSELHLPDADGDRPTDERAWSLPGTGAEPEPEMAPADTSDPNGHNENAVDQANDEIDFGRRDPNPHPGLSNPF